MKKSESFVCQELTREEKKKDGWLDKKRVFESLWKMSAQLLGENDVVARLRSIADSCGSQSMIDGKNVTTLVEKLLELVKVAAESKNEPEESIDASQLMTQIFPFYHIHDLNGGREFENSLIMYLRLTDMTPIRINLASVMKVLDKFVDRHNRME